MRTPRRLLALCALSALVAPGCALQDELVIPEPATGAAFGGTLRVAIGPVGSIDPTNAYEPNGRLVVETMCDTLLGLDPGTGDLVPGLSDKWTITDLGRGFTLRMQKDVRFHDGTEMNSQDVSSTIVRLASQDYASYKQDLTDMIGGSDIVQGDTEGEDDEDREKLWGLTSRDARALEMVAFVRRPDLHRIFVDPATSPLPRRALVDDPQRFDSDPVCVGPYELAEPWEGGDEIRLVRNEHYNPINPAFTSGGQGYADEIVFRIFDTPAEQVEAYRQGQVDVSPVSLDEVRGMRESHGADLIQSSAHGIEFVGVNANSGPWASAAARTALSLAIDRQRIARTVYEGVLEPATSFFPPALGDAYHRPNACRASNMELEGPAASALPGTDLDPLPTRAQPDLARRILDEFTDIDPRGETLSFAFNTDGRNRQLAEAVAAMWESTFPGLTVELEGLPWREYQQRATSTEGLQGAFRLSWAPEYPGPDEYITPLFTADGIGEANWARFTNPAFDDTMFRFVRAVETEEDMVVEYQRAEEQLCLDVPMIPVVYGGTVHAIDTDRVGTASGTYVHRATGRPVLRELFLSDART